MPHIYQALSFVIGVLPLTILPKLPTESQFLLLVAVIIACSITGHQAARYCAVTLFGFCWAAISAAVQLQQINWLSAKPVLCDVKVERVESARQRIQIAITRAEGSIVAPVVGAWIYVNKPEQYCMGQQWRMRLQLRPVHSRLNQAGYDSQRNAIATYTPLQAKLISAVPLDLSCSLRDKILKRQLKQLQSLPQGGVVAAFVFGIRDNIPTEITQLFKETGVAHIMAISGMHITMLALCGIGLCRLLQLLFPAHLINYQMPLYCGWVIALIYTWLSGNQPSALRALMALSIWLLIRKYSVNLKSGQVLILCLACLFFIDPLLVLSDSLWLSVIAIIILLIWTSFFKLPDSFQGKWRWAWLRLLHLQLGMLLVMLPIQISLFNGISLTALQTNMFAIPITSFVTLPLALLGFLTSYIPVVSETLWQFAERSIHWLILLLDRQRGWLPLAEPFKWAGLIWGGLILMRWGGWRRFPLSVCTFYFCLQFSLNSDRALRWQVDMLDIGQGLAVVIRQGKQAILFDTGNRWPGGDYAKQIIIPWLQHQQLQLNTIIVSHNDADHSGGLASLRQAFPSVPIRSNFNPLQHLRCQRGDQWQWQRLHFAVLWPILPSREGKNNDSCVIKVSDGQFSLLLTGDIERGAEIALAELEKQQLHSTFIQVPHHGSRTSSSALFLRRVAGEVALSSAARYNPWRFPSTAVQSRYHDAGYQWFDTALSGQISLKVYRQSYQVLTMREHISRRWYHQWFGSQRDSG